MIKELKCALCKVRECYLKGKDCPERRDEMKALYSDETDKKMHMTSTWLESEYYMKYTRLEELIEFAKKMGYKKLGIGFCIGLINEAEVLHKILEQHFDVTSVCCKVCGINKSELDLPKIKGRGDPNRYESMCNPLGQATLLNDAKTDLNIGLGLCVGHDILFTKYCKAPVTIFAVKDRVTTHNPLAVIYSAYYKKYKFGLKE